MPTTFTDRTASSTGLVYAEVVRAAAEGDGKRKWCQSRRIATRHQTLIASVDRLRRQASTQSPEQVNTLHTTSEQSHNTTTC